MGVDEASVVPFIFKRLHKKWELQEIASVDIYDLGARGVYNDGKYSY